MGWFSSNYTFEGKGLLSSVGIEYNVLNRKKSQDTITIDPRFTSIDKRFFSGAEMSHISLSPNLLTIGEYCFNMCSNLEKIELPGNIQKIECGTFNCCVNLKKISLPNGITEIGDKSFLECNSLEEVILPSSLKVIGESAFSGCRSLKSIVIPDSVKIIHKEAFSGCTNLSIVKMPSQLHHLSEGVFRGCCSLANIVVPEGIRLIGYRLFENCKNLRNVLLPSSLREIDYDCFIKCSQLNYLSIPKGFKGMVNSRHAYIASLPKTVHIFCDSFIVSHIGRDYASSQFIVEASTKDQYYSLLDYLYKMKQDLSETKDRKLFIKKIIIKKSDLYISYDNIDNDKNSIIKPFEIEKQAIVNKKKMGAYNDPHRVTNNILNAVKYSYYNTL